MVRNKTLKLIELDISSMRDRIFSLNSRQLARLEVSLLNLDQTNCWFALYHCKQFLLEACQDAREHRICLKKLQH